MSLVAFLAASGCSSSSDSGPAPLGVCGQALPATTSFTIDNSGRTLNPLGWLTTVGNLPTGGRLSPDGRFYWSVSAGHGWNDVQVVEVATGNVTQVLPMPGTYGQMTFSHDGKHAYVSGERQGDESQPDPGVGTQGDVIHVFDIDTSTGTATENTPITLPPTTGGAARHNNLGGGSTMPGFPIGITISPDDKTLVVALGNADQAVIVDIASTQTKLVPVGEYPYAAAFDHTGNYAYVSSELAGTLSKIDIRSGKVVATVSGLGGPAGDYLSHPEFLLLDPNQNRLFVAVTDHDGVAIVDLDTDTVTQFISVKRTEGWGAAPDALALSADGNTLYVANAGEDAIVAIALAARGNYKQYDIIGKVPTADYTSDVAISPDGCTMTWAAARGAGAGPNPHNDDDNAPYPSYVPDMLIGRVGVTPTPNDAAFAQFTPVVDKAQSPANTVPEIPELTPLTTGNGGPSPYIKYVYIVVKENRTYDQFYGSDPRGDGDPSLELFHDNGVGDLGNGRGTTPNQHALTRQFLLLDHFFEDSEVSVDGHQIMTGAYLNSYSTKTLHGDYSGRGRPNGDEGVFPITFAPGKALFDQALLQGVSFRDYGELSGGMTPLLSDDHRATYTGVLKNEDILGYASNIFNGCFETPPETPNTPFCAFDSGLGAAPPKAQSRIDGFKKDFEQHVSSNSVPHFNYMIMMSDHTNGTGPGGRDPLAMIADNDLGVGQLIDILSHSPIWPYTAVFVVEDDSQAGADHVDAHRAPALVISPWAKHGGVVVSTRYDQLSVLRTAELILGIQPLSVFDALATPMYDAFTNVPDFSPYTAIMPEQNLLATNPSNAVDGALSAALPFSQVDRVPQQIADRILWHRVHGAQSTPPPPGPNASPAENARALAVMDAIAHGRKPDAKLLRDPEADD